MSKESIQKKHREVFERDDGHCQYCGLDMTNAPPTTRTFDYVTPRTQGGTSKKDNLVVSCRSCTRGKKTRTVEEYRAFKREETLYMVKTLQRNLGLFVRSCPDGVTAKAIKALQTIERIGAVTQEILDAFDVNFFFEQVIEKKEDAA